MADKDTLPAVHHMAEVAVYEPPSSFEVVDRGAAEGFKFDHVGTSFVGRFEYTADVTEEKTGELFLQAIFTGADGKPYSIFPGGSLARAVHRMKEGEWYRITYDRDIDTGKPSPMKSYVVEQGR
jgi:hypothetical protein